MSQVQLQVRPRRSRCTTSCESPPFRFNVGALERGQRSALATAALVPLRVLLTTTGALIDAAFFLAAITAWCALHLTVWSYAFEMGPAATCFGLSCPEWLRAKVLVACVTLAVLSFVVSRILARLGHRATSFTLLVLVTFDVSALLVLGVRALV